MDATTLEVESSAEKTSINPPNDIFFRLEEIDEVHQARRSPVDTVGRTTVQGSYALRDIPTTWRAADLLRGMVPNLPQFREERPFLEKPVREDVWNPWGANDFYTIYLAFYIRSLFSSNLERHRFLEKVQPQQGVLLALSAQRTSTAVDPQVPRRDTQPFRSQVLEVRRRLKGYEHLVRTLTALAQQEAETRGIALHKIEIRPAWSHEYDERTGIVIDIEIDAAAEERFSYWDAICERVNQLEVSLSPEEQRLLNDEISLRVSRS